MCDRISSEELSAAVSLLCPLSVKAGEAIMKVYGTDFAVTMKEDHSPLTLADMASNEVITEALQARFPAYAILSEESKDDLSRLDAEYCFIVDPLDGTKEFVSRNGQFTVNIALVYKHKPILGVIYAPAQGHLYYAYAKGGAFFEDLSQKIKRPIHVSDRLEGLIAVGSRSHFSPREESLFAEHKDKVQRMISIGSSIKGCMIAAGEADVYYRFGLTSEWDTAAMQCIVEEAGGLFRQADGTPMMYNREDTLNRKGFYVVNREENAWL